MVQLQDQEIKEIIKKNYSSIQGVFFEVQSSFLSGIYNRYNKDLDGGNIVIYFAKEFHQQVLRQRDSDLDHDISLENFWNNHKNIKQKNLKIINISNETGLPKETTRRKINILLKSKILHKKDKKIFWQPPDMGKKTFETVVENQINDISKLVNVISNHLKVEIPTIKIEEHIKKHYSFIWFHYLSAFLKCTNIWQKTLNDLELALISLQCIIITERLARNEKIYSYKDHYLSKKIKNIDFSKADVNSTSISEVTGIPRATCIRKLNKLVSLKLIKKNKNTKRYYVELSATNTNLLFNKENTDNIIGIFSSFYLVVLKTLVREKLKS
jgi:hypothetical protein